jgi:hypothetical protein
MQVEEETKVNEFGLFIMRYALCYSENRERDIRRMLIEVSSGSSWSQGGSEGGYLAHGNCWGDFIVDHHLDMIWPSRS